MSVYRHQWPSRYSGGSGAGSDTPSGSQHPAPHAKPWPGTQRGREREAFLETVGGETLKQSWNSKGPTGPEWPEQPRTECDGDGSFDGLCSTGSDGHKSVSLWITQSSLDSTANSVLIQQDSLTNCNSCRQLTHLQEQTKAGDEWGGGSLI